MSARTSNLHEKKCDDYLRLRFFNARIFWHEAASGSKEMLHTFYVLDFVEPKS